MLEPIIYDFCKLKHSLVCNNIVPFYVFYKHTYKTLSYLKNLFYLLEITHWLYFFIEKKYSLFTILVILTDKTSYQFLSIKKEFFGSSYCTENTSFAETCDLCTFENETTITNFVNNKSQSKNNFINATLSLFYNYSFLRLLVQNR